VVLWRRRRPEQAPDNPSISDSVETSAPDVEDDVRAISVARGSDAAHDAAGSDGESLMSLASSPVELPTPEA